MSTFSQFLSNLDPDAGKRGKQFEHFVKWFLKNDPEWSTQVDQVWLWDEYPNSWGRDCGIDLVFKHKNGESWAVQAKCYAPTTPITKADVDSFISESNRDGIDKRLLIATTDLIGANAKQVCDAQDKPVTRFLLSHFEDADIEYPATLDDLPKVKRKDKPKPRDHQIEAIQAVSLNFKDVDRGQLIMACGTGKTFTTLWIKEELGVESTLVLLPSLGLLSQTLHEWTLAANEEFQVLCVCSDESVGKKSSDEAVHSIADLAFPVTSSAGEIRSFLNGSGRRVVFSTYQSSPLIAESQLDKNVPAFDLAIADEAHRCAGKVSGDFSTILDREKIRAKKRLFTTATPRTYSSSVKKAAEDRGVEVVGMDDEAVFGKQLFALNFGEAIKRGLLTDYRVVIIGVDDPTISAWIENREFLKADSDIEMDAESLAAQVGLLKAIKDYDLHRLISFHSRVSRAEEFSQDIHKVLGWIDEKHKPSGELKSDFVSGEMPTDKRRRKLAQLKGLKDSERGLLTNARCLSEGVDVPSLDGVAFIDPRSSQIDIIQAVGRAIRLSENKKAGTIVLPVFIGKSDDPEQALEEGNFKPIWDVLNALKSHDDVLADELNEIRTEMGRHSSNLVKTKFNKIQIDIPASVSESFVESIKTRLVENTTSSWEYWYGQFQNYVDKHKTTRYLKAVVSEENPSLKSWVLKQRSTLGKKLLTQNQIDRLDNLGFIWNPYDLLWEEGCNYFEKYVSEFGNPSISVDYRTKDNFNLGGWANSQRDAKKKGRLSEERINRLTLLGFVWDFLDAQWNNNYELLKKFKKEFSIVDIALGYKTPDGINLGAWVNQQRKKFENGLIDNDKIKLLDDLGLSWNPDDEKWGKAFANLKEYSNEFGSCKVSLTHVTPDGFELGNWVRYQRKNLEKFKNSQSIEKIKKLNSINFVWDPFEQLWEESFQKLKAYHDKNGNCLVPSEFETEDGFDLGGWVYRQRIKRDKLLPNQLEKLNAIGFEWSTKSDDEIWNDNLTDLVGWINKAGEINHKQMINDPEAAKIYKWLIKQRVKYKAGKLTDTQIQLMESLINVWEWSPKRGRKVKE